MPVKSSARLLSIALFPRPALFSAGRNVVVGQVFFLGPTSTKFVCRSRNIASKNNVSDGWLGTSSLIGCRALRRFLMGLVIWYYWNRLMEESSKGFI